MEAAGVDRIQWDVMDGVFVPNLTFGPDVIAACRPHAGVMFEAHLMVADPDPMLGAYVDAGCEMLIVHAESVTHLHRTLSRRGPALPCGGCVPGVMTVTARRRWLLVAAAVVAIALALRLTLWRDSGEPSVEEFCAEFAHLLVVDQLSLTVNPNDDTSTREAMDRTARQFADAAAAAPAEIRSDMVLLADLTAALSEAVAETASRETFDRAAAVIAAQDPFLETQDAATQRVVDYVTRNCTAAPG